MFAPYATQPLSTKRLYTKFCCHSHASGAPMKKLLPLAALALAFVLAARPSTGRPPRFRALVFYSTTVEGDHVQFANDALAFFARIASKDQFDFDRTTDWDDLNESNLAKYQLVVWLNDSPRLPTQRAAFQQYMEHGGAWLGFHAAGYNDESTAWPWFVQFLGGAVFTINSWPPLPAKLVLDPPAHPLTAGLPATYVSPANEWYLWNPDPRRNPDVRVLVTLDPSNYPLGLKDVVRSGDCPVVWTNTKYKMVYMNMGHGSRILSNPTQNQLFENAILWLGGGAPPPAASLPAGERISPRAVMLNPESGKIYAVNSEEGTLTIVSDSGRSAAKIRVGARPSTIGINPVTNRIYVGNQEDGTVSVIDGKSDRLLATVTVGDLPYVVTANSAAGKIYVSRTFSNSTPVIDAATNEVRILNTGVQATSIASSAALNKTFLIGDDAVTVLDGSTGKTSTIPVPDRAWGLAVDPLTNRLYVGNALTSTLSIVDVNTGKVREVQVGETPSAIAIDALSNRAYVANYAGDSVTVLDASTGSVLATIPVGVHPQAIAVDPATHTLYVANTGSRSVTVISGSANSVLGTVNLPSPPFALAAANNQAYVKCLARDDLFAVNPQSLSATVVAAPPAPAPH